jgi:hypothetical protein
MHDEINYNVAPFLKIMFFLLFLADMIIFIELIQEVQTRNDELASFDFFPCDFNITITRDVDGVFFDLGMKRVHSTCRNWKGVSAQSSITEGGIHDVSMQLFGLFLTVSLCFVFIYRILHDGDEFGL